MTRRLLVIIFAVGAGVSILGGVISGLLYTPVSSLYEHLFRDWFARHEYREAVYYFGTFSIGLPWSLAAFLCGAGIGMFVHHRSMCVTSCAALGYILVPVVGSCYDGSMRMWRSPYGLVTIALMLISVALLFLGARCGARIQPPIG